MTLAFLSADFGLVSLWSWEPAELVVYGKWAKKKGNVISYFLKTSEWHPSLLRPSLSKKLFPVSRVGKIMAVGNFIFFCNFIFL